MKKLVLGLVLGVASAQLMAVPISGGYAAEHFYRQCTIVDSFGEQARCARDNVDAWSRPTIFSSFSTTNSVSQTDNSAGAGTVFDRGHDPAVAGVAQSEARPPVGSSFYPELAGYAASNETTRVVTTTQGVQRYENTSDAAIEISVGGQLDGTITPEAELYTEVDRLGNTVSEASSVFAGITLFTTIGDTIETDAARFPGAVGNDAFWNAVCVRQLGSGSDQGCGAQVQQVYHSAISIEYGDTNNGAFNHAFNSSGGIFTLLPGESVWVGGFLATTAMNGGIVDAFNTLVTSLVDPTTGRQITPQDGLVPRSSVSEPGSLAILLGGLLVGLFSRKRIGQQTTST